MELFQVLNGSYANRAADATQAFALADNGALGNFRGSKRGKIFFSRRQGRYKDAISHECGGVYACFGKRGFGGED